MADFSIHAFLRDKVGKEASRKWRKQGYVPAVIYGHDIEPIHLAVPVSEIKKAQQKEAKVISIAIDGQKGKTKVLIKEIKTDPLKDSHLHVDFQRVKMDELISTTIPIVIIGEDECPGLKMRGVLQHFLREIEVEALPSDLPSHLEIDISQLEIGGTIRLKDIKFPPGVKIYGDGENPVVSVFVPTAFKEPEIGPVEEAIEVPTISEQEAGTKREE